MPLTLVLGPANSAKAGEVLGAYAAAAHRGALLVVPTAADARHYGREVAEQGAVLGSVVTFAGLASEIARRAGYRAPRLSVLGRERVLARVCAAVSLEVLGPSAASPGFAAALGKLVSELQRALVSPERFAGAMQSWARGDRRRDPYARDVAALYRGYLRELERISRVDRDLYAWRSLDALRAEPGRWGGTPVFLYGFDDLDALERDCVETLSRLAQAEVTVSLSYEPGRAAFAARAEAVEELRPLAGRVLELPALDDHYELSSRSALHHVERSLFEPGAGRVDPGDAVRLLEAGGARAEAELIAAEIAGLLRAGVPEHEIVILSRSPAAAPVIERVLEQYGVPVAIERQVPFAHSALGRGLLALCRCAWRRDAPASELLAYLRCPGVLRRLEVADALERDVRRAGIGGAAQARELLGWSLQAIDSLREAQDLLPELARQARWMLAAMARGQARALASAEEVDARALSALLLALDELEELGERPSAEELIEVIETLEIPAPAPVRPGAVLVADPLGVRARRFRVVFVCGLQEGAFPLPGAPEPFLSDERRRELAASSGLRLRPSEDALARERYLFYACVSRATEQLILSYRSSDEEGNIELRSPFLADVEDLLVEGWAARRRRRLLADVVWPPDAAPTAHELARSLASAGAAAAGEPELTPRVIGERALTRVRHRELASAGALENYADCPVKWLVERELSPERFESEPDPHGTRQLHARRARAAVPAPRRPGHGRLAAARAGDPGGGQFGASGGNRPGTPRAGAGGGAHRDPGGPAPVPRARGGGRLRMDTAGARAPVRLQSRGGDGEGGRSTGIAAAGHLGGRRRAGAAARRDRSRRRRSGRNRARDRVGLQERRPAPGARSSPVADRSAATGGVVHDRGAPAAEAGAGGRALPAARGRGSPCQWRVPSGRAGGCAVAPARWAPAGGAGRAASRSGTPGGGAGHAAAQRRADTLPADLLAEWMPLSRDLPQPVTAMRVTQSEPVWTAEQLVAIERREGELLLDAGAGSGKTSVLVERFVRAVLEDDVDVAAILTITFTDKAAAELRERIRERLRQLGADEAARATEGAFISTIHGFCARVLRANALAAGIDPGFAVLDQNQAERLADRAFDDGLDRVGRDEPGGVELIAAYGARALRGAILGAYRELRSRGETEPRLPEMAPGPDPAAARARLRDAAARAARELGALPEPGAKVRQALERLERANRLAASPDPWPGALLRVALPGGNGAALSTPACEAYGNALADFTTAQEHVRAGRALSLLDRLLRCFGARYAEHKRTAAGLDFEDLELLTRDLLAGNDELRERYRARFAHVMVDELQDTNRIQLDLIEQIATANVFMVGDAQQSIYGFRHADVELFERLGERLEGVGARARLETNFRSRPEILDVVNRVFSAVIGEHFQPLRAGRTDPAGGEPGVELLIADRDADWQSDGDEGIVAPWRIAEARALAGRVRELIDDGRTAREFVVLTRATTDLRAYERALEEQAIPTYVIGGRGYWAHPQIVDMVAYLRALANPREEEAFYSVLASPLVGVSVDALVVLAAAARERGRDPWWLLREPDEALDELDSADRDRLTSFGSWFSVERRAASRLSIEELIDRALTGTGYDLAMLSMPGGRRRLANVRKLMRLAREQEALVGRDLRAFLELVRGREAGWAGFRDERESEAPVEGEALDAVRLMTIHRAKGLEFPIVCVADLGRLRPWRPELLRIGRDGRLGLRIAEPGSEKSERVLDYEALGEEQTAAEEREERRVFYVALTRACERLLLSGAGTPDALDRDRSPLGWLGPAVIEAGIEPVFVHPDGPGAGAGEAGAVGPPPPVSEPWPPVSEPSLGASRSSGTEPGSPASRPEPLPPARLAAPVSHLSYSSLGEYQRCGYRFYVERVLGIPPTAGAAAGTAAGTGGLGGVERGILVHALLEKLDFRHPAVPPPAAIVESAEEPVSFADAELIGALIERFTASQLCARLARSTDVQREQRFSFLLEPDMVVTGAIDVLAREPGGRMLVVDYKSDRLEDAPLEAIVSDQYGTQRLIYALAALRAGADSVDVAHLFLERAEQPVIASFTAGDAERLQRQLAGLAGGVLRREFAVTDAPQRAICHGCPAEGGLCSWPLELTRRDAPDTLF